MYSSHSVNICEFKTDIKIDF